MAERRKREASPELAKKMERRRKRRHSDGEEQQSASVMGALTAVVVIASVVATGVALAHTPDVRPVLDEHRRLPWAQHEADLDRRGGWRRSYRMEKESFYKLVGLLRPLLEVNTFFGSLRSPAYGAICVEVRLAVALRILAGASFWDVALYFGISIPGVYAILWQVIDAINMTPAVGAFHFPQTEEECLQNANRFKDKSTDGIFSWVVAAVDGLFIKTRAPCAKDHKNVLAYYSGSKSTYGINVQAMCTADYRFCAVSAIASGSTNDWVARHQSSLSKAVARLPAGFHIIGDAAYPIGEKLLTPYPGKNLPPGEDAFNFFLSQLRVKIEQSFGILVSTWGILWRPLRVQYFGRADLIMAVFHLHNYLQDEKVAPVTRMEEDPALAHIRPRLSGTTRTLPEEWQTSEPTPSRSGETPLRAAIRTALEVKKQWRPAYNINRNS